jgi:mRNA interferase RelE/StbE
MIKDSTSFNPNLGIKKLSGFPDAYRIRSGNYRIGMFLEGDKVIFARVAHRKDIYKIFP